MVPTGQSQGGSAPSLFGGFSTPAFGASAASTPAFGAASSSAFSFGGASTPAFGAGSAPAFGGASASAPSIFGSTPGFGAANSSAFSFAGQSRHSASPTCKSHAYSISPDYSALKFGCHQPAPSLIRVCKTTCCVRWRTQPGQEAQARHSSRLACLQRRAIGVICIAAGSNTPAFGGSPGAFGAPSPASQGAFGGGLFGAAAQPQQQQQLQTQMAPGSFSGSLPALRAS